MNGEGERAKHVAYLPSVETVVGSDGKPQRVATYHQVKWDGQAWVKTGYTENTKPANAQIMNETTMQMTPEDLKLEGYGAPNLKASDFLDASGNPLNPYDAVAKWKELFPNTELDDAQILAKVKDEMPQYQAVKQEERDFARQGFKRDMYGLQSDAMKQGAQMRGAYGSGMGSSMRGAYAGGQNLQQQYSFAEKDYERDIYNLEQDAMSSYESDLANFATTAGFKEGGLVPNKKEETFLDVLARIPDAKGS